jgi:hypothetical protein
MTFQTVVSQSVQHSVPRVLHCDNLCSPTIPDLQQVHPRYQRDALGVSDARVTPLTRSDLLLDSKQWGSLVVGKVSEVNTIQ